MADGQALKYELELSTAEALRSIESLPRAAAKALVAVEKEVGMALARGAKATQTIKLKVDPTEAEKAVSSLQREFNNLMATMSRMRGGEALKAFRKEFNDLAKDIGARSDMLFGSRAFAGDIDKSVLDNLRSRIQLLQQVAVGESKVAQQVRDFSAALTKQKAAQDALAASQNEPPVIISDGAAEAAERRLQSLARRARELALQQTDLSRAAQLDDLAGRAVGADPTKANADSLSRELNAIKAAYREIDREKKELSKPIKVDPDVQAAETKLQNLRRRLEALQAGQSDPGRAAQVGGILGDVSQVQRTSAAVGQIEAKIKTLRREWSETDREQRKAEETTRRYRAAVDDALTSLNNLSKSSVGDNSKLAKLKVDLETNPQSVSATAQGIRKTVEKTVREAKIDVRVRAMLDNASQISEQLQNEVLSKTGSQQTPLFDPDRDKEAIDQIKKAYQAMVRDINAMRETSENESVATVRAGVEARLAAYRQEVSGILGNQLKIDAGRAKDVGKQNLAFSQIFQVQQAVEDFSYAGLRGAGNNIALLLSQMGKVGSVGLIGITAVTAGYMVYNALVTESIIETEAFIDAQEELAKTRQATFDAFQKPDGDRAENARNRAGLQVAREEQTTLQETLRLLKQLETFRVTARKLGRTGNVLIDPAAFETTAQKYFQLVNELEARGIQLPMELKSEGFTGTFDLLAGNGEEALTKLIESYEKQFGKVSDKATELAAKLRAFDSGVKTEKAQKAFEDFAKKIKDAVGEGLEIDVGQNANGALQKLIEEAQDRVDQFGDTVKKKLEEQLAEIDSEIALRARKLDDPNTSRAEKDRLKKEIDNLNLQKQFRSADASDEVGAAANKEEVTLRVEMQRLQLAGQIEQALDRAKTALEKQRDTLQDIIQKEAERARTLAEARKDSGTDFALRREDANLSAQTRDIEDFAKKSFEREAEAIRARTRNRPDFQVPEGINPVVDQMRRAQEQADEALINSRQKFWERYAKRNTEEATKAAMQNKMQSLEGRLGQVTQDADTAAKGGEFERAQTAEERRREILRQQQDLLLQQAAQGGPGAKGFADRADLIQKDIEASFRRSEELANQAQTAARARLQEVEAALKQVENLKQQVANVQLVKDIELDTLNKMQQSLLQIEETAKRIAALNIVGQQPGGAGAPQFPGQPFFGGNRAGGGPVARNNAYIVGEQGPELFIPNANGGIASATVVRGMLAAAGAVSAPQIENTQMVSSNDTTIGSVEINHFGFGTTPNEVMSILESRKKSEKVRRGRA